MKGEYFIILLNHLIRSWTIENLVYKNGVCIDSKTANRTTAWYKDGKAFKPFKFVSKEEKRRQLEEQWRKEEEQRKKQREWE